MSESDSGWDLPVGSVVRRADLHRRFGGNAQAGIAPCRDHPHILLFTDPAAGPEHGYYAEWAEDGTFHYTGQGQHGDQVFDRANKAVRSHHEQGRSLRLFETTAQAGFCRYLGEFEVDPVDPYHLDRAPGAGDPERRAVIVFHLIPVGPAWSSREDSLDLVEQRSLDVADAEAADAEQHLARPNVDTVEKERRERELLIRYAEHLRRGGASITRRIYRAGSARSLACDAFDETNNVLIEARATTDRNSLRLAVGQLLDYARFHHPRPVLRVVLAREPGPDLAGYLTGLGIQIAYPDDGGFALRTW
ncbi:MAG: hypothetical protein MUE66_06545 [Acidimicrobiia bacterium]|nr:hypothetical protein [Acidimicrobiia bacterium]